MFLLKSLVFLIVLAIIIVFGLLVYVGPIGGELAKCYSSANSELDTILQEAKENKWKEAEICRHNYEVLQNLKKCSEEVQVRNSIPVSYIERITKILRPELMLYQDLVDWQNQKCAKYKDLQVFIPIGRQKSISSTAPSLAADRL